jgi:hypothetical protein
MPDKQYFFDSIMMRQHKMRTLGQGLDNPLKLIDDVVKLLSYIQINLPSDELLKNTYFLFLRYLVYQHLPYPIKSR